MLHRGHAAHLATGSLGCRIGGELKLSLDGWQMFDKRFGKMLREMKEIHRCSIDVR